MVTLDCPRSLAMRTRSLAG